MFCVRWLEVCACMRWDPSISLFGVCWCHYSSQQSNHCKWPWFALQLFETLKREREKSSARLIIAPRTLPTISLGRACNLLMPIPSAALTHQTLNLKCGENLRVEPRCRLVCVPTSRCVWYGQFAWRFGARHLSVKRSIRKRRGGQQHMCWKLMLAMESLEFVGWRFQSFAAAIKWFAERANVKIAKKWLIHYTKFSIH